MLLPFHRLNPFYRSFLPILASLLLLLAAMAIPAAAEVVLPELNVTDQTTIAELVQQSHLPQEKILQALSLKGPVDPQNTLADLGIEPQQAKTQLIKAIGIAQTDQSKNWKLILSKFVLWILALAGAGFILQRSQRLKSSWGTIRWGACLGAALIFGVVLGSDPNPMGTIKDAFVFYGRTGAIFPPRMIAFTIFLLMSVIAARFICGWGCHLGGLQEFIFRLRQKLGLGSKEGPGVRVPFTLALTLRLGVLALVIVSAVAWAADPVGAIDPFMVFEPAKWTLIGASFTAFILILSAFVYRPWCTLACPFGTIAWLVERFAWLRVRFSPERCTNCRLCEKVCPSGHTGALIDGKGAKPDCFACGGCLAACPNNALSFGRTAATLPCPATKPIAIK